MEEAQRKQDRKIALITCGVIICIFASLALIINLMNGENEMQSGLEEGEEETILPTEEQGHNPNYVGMEKGIGQGDDAGADPVKIDYEAAAANGYQIYVVGEGETLYGICWNRYGSLEHLKEICQLNKLKNVDRILAGQKLILP